MHPGVKSDRNLQSSRIDTIHQISFVDLVEHSNPVAHLEHVTRCSVSPFDEDLSKVSLDTSEFHGTLMTTNHHLVQRFRGVPSVLIRHVNCFDEETEAGG